MLSNQKLFSVGSFDFRLQHLLIIGILSLSFTISMLIRSGPLAYETELFEYDPFFNIRATEFVVNNGFESYFNWHDEKSWHPYGRNISETSQVTLHLTAATLYQIFNFGMSLHTFTIMFPLVIGSLTTIVVFAFVRVLGGTTAGLFASLMFAISIPIFIRGFAGWFKSEPLGIFFGILAFYLFVSGIKYNKGKISFAKLFVGGIILALSLSAWGGSTFFLLAILLFFFALPFFKNEGKFLIWSIPTFSISFIIFSLLFERTADFTIGYLGIAVLLSTIFVVVSEIIKHFSPVTKKLRNCILFLVSIIISSVGIFFAGFVGLPTFRYLNAVNPLLFAEDALTESVQEHAVTNMTASFSFFSIFLIFGLVGIWLIFSKKSISLKNDMKSFSLITSLFAIYLSSAFLRLELFAGIGLLILGGIGLSLFFKEIFSLEKPFLKYVFSITILCLFIIPVTLPVDAGWASWSNYSPTIISGGSGTDSFVSYDWIEAGEWIKKNTPEDAVIAAWWDYGYWITGLSDRATIADNATLLDWQIQKIAYSFLASPDDAWKILHSSYDVDVSSSYTTEFRELFAAVETPDCVTVTAAEHNQTGKPMNFCVPSSRGLDADFVLVYAVVDKIASPGLDTSLYTMRAGGDESKKTWFAKISNQDPVKLVLSDGQSPSNYFMHNTALGQLIPFETAAYFDPKSSMILQYFGDEDFIPIYSKKIKLSDPDNDPFYLVYASPSFFSDLPGQKNIVLIYKINSDYNP